MQPQNIQPATQPNAFNVGAMPINPILFAMCFHNMSQSNNNIACPDNGATVSVLSILLALLFSQNATNNGNTIIAQTPQKTTQDAQWDRLYDEYVNSFEQYKQRNQSARDASQYWQGLYESINKNKLQNPFLNDVRSAANTLGISVNATPAELKQAYRKLCLSCQPNVSKVGPEQTVAMVQQIVTAHAIMLQHISQNPSVKPTTKMQTAKPVLSVPQPALARVTKPVRSAKAGLPTAKSVRSMKKTKKIKKPKVYVKKSAASKIMPIVKSGKQTKQVLVSKPQLTTNTAKMPLHLLRLQLLLSKRYAHTR